MDIIQPRKWLDKGIILYIYIYIYNIPYHKYHVDNSMSNFDLVTGIITNIFFSVTILQAVTNNGKLLIHSKN